MWSSYTNGGRLKEELLRLGCAIVWFGVTAFCMAMVQINGDSLHARHVRSHLGTAKEGIRQQLMIAKSLGADDTALHNIANNFNAIHDIAFHTLPNLPAESPFNPDLTLHSYIIISLIAGLKHWDHLRFIARLRRFLWLFGAGYLLRMCTLAATVLPPSDHMCEPKERGLLEMVLMAPQLLVGRARTCTDKLFSGHTLVATLLLWFWWDARTAAGDRLFSIWRIYAVVHALTMVLASLIGWNHFTVDVVLAFIISSLLFWFYKSILVIGSHRKIAENLGASLDSQESHCVPHWLVRLIGWCDGADLEPILEPVGPPEQMQEV